MWSLPLAVAALVGLLSVTAIAEETYPIAEVIETFKREIHDAHLRGSDDMCRLTVQAATFRFIAATETGGTSGLGDEVKFLGLTAGAGISGDDARAGRSTIEMTLVPEVAGTGFYEVSGSPAGLTVLILDVKDQIERAAATEPSFGVKSVRIEQYFEIRRTETGHIRFIGVQGGHRELSQSSHHLELTLGAPEDGGC